MKIKQKFTASNKKKELAAEYARLNKEHERAYNKRVAKHKPKWEDITREWVERIIKSAEEGKETEIRDCREIARRYEAGK